MAARPITLITGASAGLGAEFARQCAARGEALVLVARRADALDALAATLDGQVHVHARDLAAPGAAEALFAWLARNDFVVETLINNAGYGLGGDFADRDRGRLLGMIDLNVRVLTELCHLALAPMRERGRGAILNVASTAAFQPGPHMAVYYATKAYVLSFTEALHQEMKGSGVRLSALCPGPTRTEFFDVAEVKGLLPRLAVPSQGVVRAGLRGLDKGRAVIIPGVRNKLLAQGHRVVPRGAMRRLIARIKTN